MLVADPIVPPGRGTKAVDSFVDRGTVVFRKNGLYQKHA